jgi:chaperone BCS1
VVHNVQIFDVNMALRTYGYSAVRIDDNDGLYRKFMAWMSAQRMAEISRDLKAHSSRPRGGIKEADVESNILKEAGYFNYRKWADARRVYYEPNNGSDSFVHDGKRFLFEKGERENKYQRRFEEFLIVRCPGRSTQPIKDLIIHVKDWTSNRATDMADVYCAAKRNESSEAEWDFQVERRSRPIETVSLEEDPKQLILNDINEYLHPVTANW